jgi:hypothetical protein
MWGYLAQSLKKIALESVPYWWCRMDLRFRKGFIDIRPWDGLETAPSRAVGRFRDKSHFATFG